MQRAEIFAQQIHFIYIQTDDKQPFYAIINDQTYHSSQIGYLIIPKLKDGEYHLTLGSSSNQFPEQEFVCVVNKKNAGYALKSLGANGWGLYNLQTSEIITAGEKSTSVKPEDIVAKKDTIKSNPFGDMLSQVVDDPDLTKAAVPEPVTINKPEEKAGVNTQAATLNKLTDSIRAPINNPESVSLSKGVIKAYEHLEDTGRNVVFVDFDPQRSDTISIFIPLLISKPDESRNNTSDKLLSNEDATSQNDVNNPFYIQSRNITNNAEKNTASEVNSNSNTKTTSVSTKPDCTKMLGDNDFNKLKRKLFLESSDEEMIQISEKYCKGKCVTTNQLEDLSIFFLTDEGRYNFFSSLYNYVNDPANFSSLENRLIDPAYRKRFQAMLKQK